MKILEETVQKIDKLDTEMIESAWKRVDSLIKPPKSLGRLEEIAVQLVGITRNPSPSVERKAMIVMAADHGVYEEGISSNPQEVTLAQTLLFQKGLTGVCAIGKVSGAKITAVDIGIKGELPEDSGVIGRKVKHGTENMAKGPAMTREEAIRSIEVGIEMANREVKNGIQLLGTGEMGIGNTTPSTAILSVLKNCDPLEITGKGAGVGPGGIEHKASVIRQAIEKNQPNPSDGIDVLAKVGGLEIGGMAGVMLGAAANRIPVVVDGYISTVAALIAAAIEPNAKDYFIASHASAEPGGRLASELLGIEPMLTMDMCLGEGSGAALAFPIIDAAVSMMNHMATFTEVGMEI
ncbi:nicotinate-nucleotide--dimethylbenzimidazole phosphoribosyltransferase [Sporosarcina gallistercoris]|uniref:Nicotinate-nucleotide--dimethylbenzimidazole phosphoribosyltransferase n=1 Tax=Sporosarcina gallistercoris TaxID=2762245 RepID=A0ABR8PK50_9BACL|nr:nicotinate-nucleotide--dimethylbenzimidazole phosphoribosyltransferase [Sporosarcina gallistercoris]MBD7908534.1 nicotinate-nucleotide--dimethylbenzimidazole phosphoribosyltransferase [Sporosarcina gallistercoris]